MKKVIPAILILIAAIAAPLAPGARASATITQTAQPADQVDLKLERGGKVFISNRAGKITVRGGEGNKIEARATDEDGLTPVPVVATEDRAPGIVRLSIGRRTARDKDGHREPRLPIGDADLVVQVPRYASIEIVESFRADIAVSDVQGNVFINQGSGDVDVKRVGPLRIAKQNGDVSASEISGGCQIKTANGDIDVSNVKGTVDVGTANGDLNIRDTDGDVRANSATGSLDIRCVKGRADANTASGSISLVGVGGDSDANTASGDVIFRGRIQAGGRYRLKSISGEVEMSMQPEPPGFTATMSSYNGELETDFPLKVESSSQSRINKRVVGRYGDGQAQLTLDSFSGAVRILKGVSDTPSECK